MAISNVVLFAALQPHSLKQNLQDFVRDQQR